MERSDIRGWGTSWPGFRCAQFGLRLLSRHGRACPGHDAFPVFQQKGSKAWMPATSAGM